ncbi:MAG TPA: YdiU family protein [Spirochaetaceae bacterium]|nr:YdiU family protein [Spirochaetaceae bacterium]
MLRWKLESSYTALPERFYTYVTTDTPPSPEWAVFNTTLAEALGMGSVPEPEDLAILSGVKPPPGAKVFAQGYAGHQFGHFTILGDGRAALLGEVVDPHGARWDLQLKGSGPTPYARGGDGKAALGPMLREYLIGEYLNAVGIPSTRALSVALSGESIRRDGYKPGAVLCRVAASHLRIGTFQYAAALSDIETLGSLADYALARHYPQLRDEEYPYRAFLDAVGSAQADLVARWMCLGFVHGVMNTDNVSISGQAIDFGPCAFLDAYKPDQAFSSIDRDGRYAWGRQAAIAAWNHARLAEALLPLIDENAEQAIALAQESIERFNDTIEDNLITGFARKLGLSQRRTGDDILIQKLLSWMEGSKADFTATFWALTQLASQRQADYPLPDEAWLRPWLKRLEGEAAPAQIMTASNPPIHPRNRAVQSALDEAEHGDLRPFHRLAASLAKPWHPDSALPELEPSDSAQLAPFKTYCGT